VVTALQQVVLRPNRTFGAKKKASPGKPTDLGLCAGQAADPPGALPLGQRRELQRSQSVPWLHGGNRRRERLQKMTMRIGRSMEGININGLF
jgi:hypothetical protein